MTHPPRPSLTYQLVSSLLVFPVFRILFRGRVSGRQNVPTSGSLVVVANHGSHLDPPLLGHALGRPVAFMAKEELFRAQPSFRRAVAVLIASRSLAPRLTG